MTGLVADRKQILSAALFRLVCWLLYMLDLVADCPDSGSGLFLSVGVVLHMVFVYSVPVEGACAVVVVDNLFGRAACLTIGPHVLLAQEVWKRHFRQCLRSLSYLYLRLLAWRA